MNLTRLLDSLDTVRISGRLGGNSPVVSLRGFDSVDAEPTQIPVSSVFVEDSLKQVALIADPLSTKPGLSISELARILQDLPAKCGGYDLTVTGEWLESEVGVASAVNLDVIAIGVNPVLGVYGLIPWFEGHGDVFD